MAIEIKSYTDDKISSVIDFNMRLKAGGAPFSFSESNIPMWLPKIGDRKIFQEYFLALENNSVVRGAYILKHQEFSFKGDIVSIADFHGPISEGIVDKKFINIGFLLLSDALKKQPLLFGLGMGGYDEPITKMLRALNWEMITIPFRFKVNKPYNFLKNISFLRKSNSRKLIFNFLAITGLGWVVINLLQSFLQKKRVQTMNITYEIVKDFSHWADKLWDECKIRYDIIAVRDSQTLNILYSRNNDKYIRLKIIQNEKVVGWALVVNTQMNNHKKFGDMRVGSIVDFLALPEDANKVIVCATGYLESIGVDIIVSNQSHYSWCSALKQSGFIKGPSNFIFAASKKLSELIHPIEVNKANIHLNRGDGDGPINL